MYKYYFASYDITYTCYLKFADVFTCSDVTEKDKKAPAIPRTFIITEKVSVTLNETKQYYTRFLYAAKKYTKI